MPGPGLATDETCVRVAVRVRPLLGKEIVEKCRECVTVDNSNRQVIIGKNRGFTFDYTFNQNTEQEHIYDTSVVQLVESIFQGYNATVFAYGQTGSGKTHTMGTAQSTTMHSDDAGIIPRVISAIFDGIEKRKGESDFMLRCSYLEIYNEAVKDLLNPSTDTKSISIREDDKKGIVVCGVKEEVVTSFDDMVRCLQTGALYRTTGKTLMNEESSRSHSIFTIIVEQRVRESPIGSASGEYIMAKFHLVDLAGSERNKRTGAVGLRFKESVQINSGLLALGNVISALGDDKKRAHVSHVPYRESKLTRLLQDSLGGNSNTLMIACVSPADVNFEETLNTLKYANRARNIKNMPIVNRDPHAAQLAHLRSQIQTLQLELLKHRVERDENGEPVGEFTLEELLKNEENLKYLEELKNKTVTGFGGDLSTPIQNQVVNSGGAELSMMREQNQSLRTESRTLREQLDKSQKMVSGLSEDLFLLQSERDKLQQRKREFCSEIIQAASTMRDIESRATDPQRRPLNEMINKIDHMAKRERFELDKSNRRVNDAMRTPQLWGNSDPTRPSTASDFRSTSYASQFSSFEPSPRPGTSTPKMTSLEMGSPVSLTTIQRLQSELKDAKDDLSRDEKIFAEKFREIKDLSRTNNALKRDLDTLHATLSVEAKRSGQLQDCVKQAIQTGSLPEDLSSQFLMLIDVPLSSHPQGTSTREKSSTSARATTSATANPIRQPIDNGNVNDSNNNSNGSDGATISNASYDTQEIEEVQAGLHQLELEKQRIEQEKVKIEKRKQTFEAQANEYQHFHAEQKKMEKTLKDLTVMIRLKEELIKDLVKSEHESRVIKQQYEQKIHEMESEMRATHAELEKVLKELENADMEQAKKEKEKQRIQSEYEAKLKRKETELADLKTKELETRRLVKLKAKSDKRIRELESEIGKLKTQHDYLKRKMRDDSDRQSEINEGKMRQITSLKREAESNYKRIRDLEQENQKQRHTLRQKMEQMERQKYQRLKIPSLQAVATHLGSPISTARKQITEEIDKQKAWLDREIEKYLNKKEVMEHLEKELRRRETIIQEKESMISKRQDLERRRLRTSQVMHQSIAGLNRQIELLDDEIRRKENAIDRHQQMQQQQNQWNQQQEQQQQQQQPNQESQNSLVSHNVREELYLLMRKKERAEQQKHKLEEKARHQQVKEEEVMRELEERTDVLEAEIEYKNEAIENAQREISDNVDTDGNGTDEIDRIGEQLTSLDDAKDMLRKYFDKVIELKEAEREKDTRVMELNMFLGERDKIIDNLQNNIRLTEQVYERRLTKQQKENELKIQYLMKQIQSLESPISDRDGNSSNGGSDNNNRVSGANQNELHVQSLEREAQYYKRTNRELKQKLREFKSVVQQQHQQIHALRQEQEVPRTPDSRQKQMKQRRSRHQRHHKLLRKERGEDSDDSLVIIDEEQLATEVYRDDTSVDPSSHGAALIEGEQGHNHGDKHGNHTVKKRHELTEISEEEVIRRKKQIQEKLEKQQAYQRQWMQEVQEQQIREQQEYQGRRIYGSPGLLSPLCGSNTSDRLLGKSPRTNASPADDVVITVECDDDNEDVAGVPQQSRTRQDKR